MTAKALIEVLSKFDPEELLEIVYSRVQGSIWVDYDPQVKKWNQVAQETGLTLESLAKILSKVGDPFPGIEGLYELTKDKDLFQYTDYSAAGENDGYVVSYFYGGNTRREAFERNVGKNPEAMAASIGYMLEYELDLVSSKVVGRAVTFDYQRAVEITAKPDWGLIYKTFDEIIDGLIKHGWVINDHRQDGYIVMGGGELSDEVRHDLLGD